MSTARDMPTVETQAVRGITFGLVPTIPDLRDPRCIKALSDALGMMWSVRSFDSYSDVVKALRTGDIDVAWLPPVAYVMAAREGIADLVLTLERAGQPSFASALIVRAEPDATSFQYVRKKRAVWVDALSSSGYLYPRRLLRIAGYDPDRVFTSQTFSGSHGGVVEAILSGTADVGGTFCSLDAHGRMIRTAWQAEQPIKVLAVSDPIPGDTVCVSSSIGVREGRIIAQRFTTMAGSIEGRAILVRCFGADTFREGNPARYGTLEAAVADEPL